MLSKMCASNLMGVECLIESLPPTLAIMRDFLRSFLLDLFALLYSPLSLPSRRSPGSVRSPLHCKERHGCEADPSLSSHLVWELLS
jgi:hypothetical protein